MNASTTETGTTTVAAAWPLHVWNSGTVAGLVAAAWMVGTSALLGLPVDGPLVGAAFCGTSLLYLLDRALDTSPEDAVNRPEREAWRRGFRGWIWAEASLMSLALAVLAPFLQTPTLLIVLLVGVTGALHVWPLVPGARRLKSVGPAKTLVVAATWAVGGVVLPVVEAGAAWTTAGLALLGLRFAFVLTNVLLADWGDRAGDTAVGLRTLASRWSARRLRIVATALAGIAVVGSVALSMTQPDASTLWRVDAVGPALLGVAVWRIDPSTQPWHAVAADLLVAWPAVTFAATWLP